MWLVACGLGTGRINTRDLRISDDLELPALAAMLDGYSGADVHVLCRDAAMMTMRKAVEGKSPAEIIELQQSGALEGELRLADFEQAMRRTPPSVSADDLSRYDEWNAEFGFTS